MCRLWLLFLLTYSLFIRENLRRGLLRRTFLHKRFRPLNSSIPIQEVCNHTVRGCLSVRHDCKDDIWTTSKISLQDLAPKTTNETLIGIQRITKICHREEGVDSSQITLCALAVFLAVIFVMKLWWVSFRKNRQGKRCTRPTTTSCLTLAALLAYGVFVLLARDWDDDDIQLVPSSWSWQGGFLLLKLPVLIIAIFLIAGLLLKICCFKIYRDQMVISYLTDPEELMQWFTLVASVATLCLGDVLWYPGCTALSVAMAGAVVVIKIGQSGFNSFGNFATMFHIILKKMPFYFFAILILIHGFAIGFWILETSLTSQAGSLGGKEEDKQFGGYWRSGITVFMMSFGLAEFNFQGPFSYSALEEYRSDSLTVLATYILLVFMVFLVILGLLNLLLSTIIRSHYEGKTEVTLNKLIFMAKYAIWLDFNGVTTWLPPTWNFLLAPCRDNKSVSVMDIPKDKAPVFCNLSFCPRKSRARKEEHGDHLAPHFQWVVEELARREQGDVRKELREWVRRNRSRREVDWGRMDDFLNRMEAAPGLDPASRQAAGYISSLDWQ